MLKGVLIIRGLRLEIEQDAQPLGDATHRRLSDLTASRAEALLGDGADLVAEDVARAAEPTFGGPHFDVKRNPALRSRERKHHYKARSASVEAIGRNHHRRADEILLMTPGRAEIDRPDFTA